MTGPAQQTRVLVADSHPLFARGVAGVLREDDALWVQIADVPPLQAAVPDGVAVLVVGVAGDAAELWEVCDHLVASRALRQARLVLLLPGAGEFEMTAAAGAGAAAVLPRSASPGALRDAVTAVADGRTLVAPGMSERMLHDFAGMLRRQRESAEVDLSRRETEVLELVAAGRSNRDIAGELHISDNTVKNHVRRILEKLGAGSRTEAVAIAARHGIVVVGQRVWSPSARRA